MQPVHRCFTMVVMLLAAAASNTDVAAQEIIITNADNHVIPLRSGSSVQIDSSGNLLAECELTNNTCQALSGSPGGAPTVTFARNDGDTEIRAGEFVRLTWAAPLGTVCNAASTGPVATTFVGPRTAASTTTGETVVVSAVGSYALSLQCFNGSGGSIVQTESFAVVEGPVDPPACDLTSADPAFQPTNFTRVNKTWQTAFSSPDGTPQAAYPNSVSFPVPIGALKGSYTTIPFTPNANQTINIFWDPAQARPQDGYSPARPAIAMFVGISPCPGDLRAPNVGLAQTDPFLHGGCRKFEGTASLFYTTKPGASNDNLCKLEAGRTYYLNVIPANVMDGLTPGEHSCSNDTIPGCDVQMIHRPQ